jgi:branched-chain amino acid aminotransferase
MSLMELAEKMGMKVEKRQIAVEELESFEEVGACGTAAVITPIRKIFDPLTNKVFEYCCEGNPGPVSVKLYNQLIAIQYGDVPDTFGWTEFVS